MTKTFILAAAFLLLAAPLHAQPARTCARRPAADKAAEDSARAVQAAVRRAMAREVRVAARAAGIERAEGLLILRADSLNQTRIFPAEINFPVDVLREIEPRLQAEIAKLVLTPNCPLIARIDSASVELDSNRLASGRGEQAPIIINRGEVLPYLEAWATGDRRPRRQRMVVAGLVTRSGRGIIPEIVESSGDPELDQFGLHLFRIFKFRPASVNGRTVDVWIVLPLGTDSRW
ncbi:MAG TPA: hypothetical protein VF625_01500 [Longimicrobium sp.]|jgi:hypothetical protein